MTLTQTKLQIIHFGNEPEDIFYCLVDKRISPNGMDVNALKLADPRNIDHQFKESGCLLMFTGDEIQSLINRGEIDAEDLHASVFELAMESKLI